MHLTRWTGVNKFPHTQYLRNYEGDYMYNILLVDDYQVFRKSIMRLPFWKTTNEFSVKYEASDGIMALDLLSNEPIDIVITDIKMPKLDGIGLLTELKKRDFNCPVILLSEFTEFEYARQGIILGAFDYIVKPITNDKLKDVLERAKPKLIQSQKEDPLTFFINELISSIKNNISNVSNSLNNFTNQFYILHNNNPTKAQSVLMDITNQITQSALESYPWISNVIKCEDCVCQKYRLSNNVDEMINIFSDYVISINKILEKYIKFSNNNTINMALYYILNNPYTKLSLSDIAEECYINKAYLSHTFKTETGISITDYITNYKIDISKKMLKKCNVSISEIAISLGYEDAKYFSRLFKNICNMSPVEYRKVKE